MRTPAVSLRPGRTPFPLSYGHIVKMEVKHYRFLESDLGQNDCQIDTGQGKYLKNEKVPKTISRDFGTDTG